MVGFQTVDGKRETGRCRDFVGRWVRSKETLTNGQGELPAGYRLQIVGWCKGAVHLLGAPCPHCGVRIYIRKVSRQAVVLEDAGRSDASDR